MDDDQPQELNDIEAPASARGIEPPSGWLVTFRALRHRNFALFWCGQLISLIGTWMQSLAQSWLVQDLVHRQLRLSNASLYLGLVSAAGSFPTLLLTLYAGVIADRFDKRRIIIATQTWMMILAFILAWLTWHGVIQIWQVMVMAALLGVANAFDMPTRQAFVKDMVGPEDLLNAIALNSSMFNGARIIGPAVAGVLVALPGIGVSGAFFLNGVSFIAVIAGLLAIRLPRRSGTRATGHVWQHLREGFSYVRHHRVIRALLIVMSVFSTFGFSYIVLLPAVTTQILKGQANVYGLLLACGGLGALIGALTLATLAGRVRKGSVLLVGSLLFAPALLALGASRQLYLTAALLALTSAGLVACSATINSLIQETVPDHLRGRVMSIWMFVFAGFAPLGALFVGTMAHFTSIPLAYFLCGLVCVSTVIGVSVRIPWLWKLE